MSGNKNAHLLIKNENKEIKLDLPIHKATIGSDTIDITTLYKDSKNFTYDPGFVSTASCRSKITFIDGEKGILLYRGYKIDELAEHSNFLEVSYLLLHGELPNKQEQDLFHQEILDRAYVHEQLQFIFRGFARKAHPMAMLIGSVAGLSSFHHDTTDILSAESRISACYNMIAKIPTLATLSYKYSQGDSYQYPNPQYSFAANFLHMLFSSPNKPYEVTEAMEHAIDMLFILHADHEQNASTSTVRLAGSSQSNPYAAIAAGIASLWGKLHGGANEAVINMLSNIGSTKNIDQYILKAKDKKDPFRLMGFGHRVYKNYDPRAKVLKKACDRLLKELGINDPLLDVALKLEEIALKDSYFIEKKLYPNVDFYSGIIYRALGIPSSMFTVMFAIARTTGWVSQWKEMIEDPEFRIARPRQIYEGYNERSYIPLNKR